MKKSIILLISLFGIAMFANATEEKTAETKIEQASSVTSATIPTTPSSGDASKEEKPEEITPSSIESSDEEW